MTNPPSADIRAGARDADASNFGPAVAVAERDPVEFPGTPLPDGFFDHIRVETAASLRPRLSRRLIAVLLAVGVGLVGLVTSAIDRNKDLASPARHLVVVPCAHYRDIGARLESNSDDFAAMDEALDWMQTNEGRFREAAELDPALAGAAEYIAWFNALSPDDVARISDAEISDREEDLFDACWTGPGRS